MTRHSQNRDFGTILTVPKIEALRPKERRYYKTDAAIRGLQLRVECSGCIVTAGTGRRFGSPWAGIHASLWPMREPRSTKIKRGSRMESPPVAQTRAVAAAPALQLQAASLRSRHLHCQSHGGRLLGCQSRETSAELAD
jgi:hypothetical protein